MEEAIELLSSYDMQASLGDMVHFAIVDRAVCFHRYRRTGIRNIADMPAEFPETVYIPKSNMQVYIMAKNTLFMRKGDVFMHYTGTIWRPSYEAESLLVEVTAGCSHHKYLVSISGTGRGEIRAKLTADICNQYQGQLKCKAKAKNSPTDHIDVYLIDSGNEKRQTEKAARYGRKMDCLSVSEDILLIWRLAYVC